MSADYIKENLSDIRKKIKESAEKSARAETDITFVCVTKTISTELIKEAINEGVTDLGENRVQELQSKFVELENVNWHMIGNLQTNKVKNIIDKVKLIHSVDSLKLAKEINNQSKKLNKVMDILVEVNIANEPTKFGVDPSNVYEFVKALSDLDSIKVKGLMTVAPFVAESEKNRDNFKKMFSIMIDINGKIINNRAMTCLSMGMTNDYTTAIEEGATIVRIGTGVFGTRR